LADAYRARIGATKRVADVPYTPPDTSNATLARAIYEQKHTEEEAE
jgi:hypothetical protein